MTLHVSMVPGHCNSRVLVACLLSLLLKLTTNSPYDHYFLRSREMQEASAYAALDERLYSAETAELIITTYLYLCLYLCLTFFSLVERTALVISLLRWG